MITMNQKYIRFDNKYVGNVIDQKKKVTIRKGDPFVNAGDEVDLLTGDGNPFSTALVVSMKKLPAKELVNIDFTYHENYSGFIDFKRQMCKYYDDEIEPSTMFTIIYFEVIDNE